MPHRHARPGYGWREFMSHLSHSRSTASPTRPVDRSHSGRSSPARWAPNFRLRSDTHSAEFICRSRRSTRRSARPSQWTLLAIGVRDAGELSGVSFKAVRRMIADGVIAGYRLGPKCLRIKLDDLDTAGGRVPSADWHRLN